MKSTLQCEIGEHYYFRDWLMITFLGSGRGIPGSGGEPFPPPAAAGKCGKSGRVSLWLLVRWAAAAAAFFLSCL